MSRDSQTSAQHNDAEIELQADETPLHTVTAVDTAVADVDIEESGYIEKNSVVDLKEFDSDKDSERYFDDSIYQYLVYYGHRVNGDKANEPEKDFNGLVLAMITIFIQWVLFGIMLGEGQALLKEDLLTVHVKWGNDCKNAENLTCKAELASPAYSVLAGVLLAMFLISDAVIGLAALNQVRTWIGRMGSVAIIATTAYGCWAGGVFAYQGIFQGSKYDIIVNCIGVLFILDVDEKVGAAYDVIKDNVRLRNMKLWEKVKCLTKCRKSLCMCCCCMLFVGIAVTAGVAYAGNSIEVPEGWDPNDGFDWDSDTEPPPEEVLLAADGPVGFGDRDSNGPESGPAGPFGDSDGGF